MDNRSGPAISPSMIPPVVSTLITLGPMMPSHRPALPFSEPDWRYEVKFRGHRMLACAGAGAPRLVTRRGADATSWFPEIAAGLMSLPGRLHVLDGEVCVLDGRGISNYALLQQPARRRRWFDGAEPVVFCAFDVLVMDEEPMVNHPWEWRKAQLRKLLTPLPPSLVMVDDVDAKRARLLQAHAIQREQEESWRSVWARFTGPVNGAMTG